MSLVFECVRYGTASESTISRVFVDNERLCYVLEDQYQHGGKVRGETCIPPGDYLCELNTDSPMAQRYRVKYPWCRGLIRLRDVPGFSHINVHPGNDDDDTDGCPLPGQHATSKPDGNWIVGGSAIAWKELTTRAYRAWDDGLEVRWRVVEEFGS